MKICILGLDCATPEVVFGDERLVNLRRLMDVGVYGRLQSVVPPSAVPAWMCMSASQDPGSLGVYGLRNRVDRAYDSRFVDSSSIETPAMWDHLARYGKKSIVIGVPPNYPPRHINGVSIGCFLTPDTVKNEFTNPPEIKAKLTDLVGEYPVDVRTFRPDHKDELKEQIFSLSGKQWQVVHWLMAEQEWDYFHFVDIGLNRMHSGFWNHFDKNHPRYVSGNSYESAIPEYYLWLDEQIGRALEQFDNETIMLVVSAYGPQTPDGGFAINEWLIEQGLLTLNEYPQSPTSFESLNVNWAKTRAWSDGGYDSHIYFNVQGREPQGVIPAAEYDSFQSEMKHRLDALSDDSGKPIGPLVLKPYEIYRKLLNVAPDLIVQFGSRRSVDSVGHGRVHVQGSNTGEDACYHSQHGIFILAAPNCPLSGEYEGASLLDIAPTLLDLAGYTIPETMQGRSLVAGMEKKSRGEHNDEADQLIQDRLAGLGYV